MGGYRILIADDHALFRQGLRRIMERSAGLEIVAEAADGLELISLMDRSAPHLIILDLSMPNSPGLEALRKIKTIYSEVKVLVLTMHKEYLLPALGAGANGYLLKEDADRDLFSAIENIRQGRVYISPRLTEQLLKNKASPREILSSREKEILGMIAKGKSNREIADILFISIRTVEFHRASILHKLNLKKTADMVRYAIEHGYVSAEPGFPSVE